MSSLFASSYSRRSFVAAGISSLAGASLVGAEKPHANRIVQPPEGKKVLLSVKLGMIAGKDKDGKEIPIADRLSMAAEAGLDGVDFDQAGKFTCEEAAEAVRASGVFVHNAINHDHWKMRFTSAKEDERKTAHDNLAHCIRLSHAAGGHGVLLVPGRGGDGEREEVEKRALEGISELIPLAAEFNQPILFENVWNQMFYDHDTPAPPNQSAERHVAFIDAFDSPWVGQYFDIGNHWKYGNPGEWIHALGHRCEKLDVKGFDRKGGKDGKGGFCDIGAGDLPWGDVRDAIDDIGFTGWATAEVGGGQVDRLKVVREQMEEVFGL